MELITVHSSSHADNLKNDFRLLEKGDAFGFNWTFSAPEKKLVSILVKQTQKICLSLHCNADNSYLFVNGREIFKFNVDNKNVNFPIQFCLESVSNGFRVTESIDVSLNGNV